MVRLATEADTASWLEIVREVEPLFGPMPAFDGTLERAIARRSWTVGQREEHASASGWYVTHNGSAGSRLSTCASTALIGA